MSFQYTIIKGIFKIIPFKKIMAKPYGELMKTFRTAKARPEIPKLSDPKIIFETVYIDGKPVLL